MVDPEGIDAENNGVAEVAGYLRLVGRSFPDRLFVVTIESPETRPKHRQRTYLLVAIAVAGFAWLLITYIIPIYLGYALFGTVNLNPTGPVGKNATYTLSWVTPVAMDDSGVYTPYTEFTAEALNAARTEELLRVTFVGPDVASTGPDVVSVYPIDGYLWGAAALSAEDGTCFLILLRSDRTDPVYGDTLYGTRPEGEPCVGRAAVEGNVSLNGWPSGE